MQAIEWEIPEGWWSCGLRVPYALGKCYKASPSRTWVCSRPTGHGGRHTAACSNGDVMAVWHG